MKNSSHLQEAFIFKINQLTLTSVFFIAEKKNIYIYIFNLFLFLFMFQQLFFIFFQHLETNSELSLCLYCYYNCR